MFNYLDDGLFETKLKNKKTVKRLLDKYGTLDNFKQNSTLMEDFEYQFAQGDDVVDEVERERQAMMRAMNNLPKQQGTSLDDGDMNVNASVYRAKNSNSFDDSLFSSPMPSIDNSLLKQYSNNQRASTMNDASVGSIGNLSAKYESNNNPKAVGHDNGGGYSYGKYQIETKHGTMLDYIKYLKSKSEYKKYANILNIAGGYEGAKEKTKNFEDAWNKLSEDANFDKSQYQFLLDKKLKPLINFTKNIKGFDIENRHPIIKEMLYSIATQHGNRGSVELLQNAIGLDITNMSDEELVNKVYDERSLVDKYFSRVEEDKRKNIKEKRLTRERAAILRLLNK